MNEGQIIYKGKFAHELTREEAIECALHFRDAHLKSLDTCAKALRRMAKMEETLTADEIEKLDWWLAHYEHDAKKGDGSDLWQNWRFHR